MNMMLQRLFGFLHRRVMPHAAVITATALVLGAAAPAAAGPVLDRVKAAGVVKVCIWPDYYGITYRSPRTGVLQGIDIELSAAFAKDLGVTLQYVESSFAKLIDNLVGDRCDVAMHAVGVTPQRQARLRFTSAYLRSDVYGVTTRANRVIQDWSSIDQPGVRVAVQAGTFMEPVMAQALKRAELVVVRPPATREQELESGRVDVFMTDYPYSRRLLDNADWARLVSPPSPFHVVPYAYAVKPGDDEWLARVEAFVQAIRGDGRLQAAAARAGLSEIAAASGDAKPLR